MIVYEYEYIYNQYEYDITSVEVGLPQQLESL